MKNVLQVLPKFPGFLVLILIACNESSKMPSQAAIDAINVKRGEVVECGTTSQQFGTVEFTTSCPDEVQDEFNLALALLHSFEYDEAEKVFAKIIDVAPGCAMAYWGIAMCNYHPLWSPPTLAELEKGAKAIAIAQSLEKDKKESAYIEAVALFYKDADKTGHGTRSTNYMKAMEKMHSEYPTDTEAAIFYALSLTAAADPADKSFANQKKAGAILDKLYIEHPDHPGIVHYIIHTYDSPELAMLALPAARKYASVAPSSAHALHMPSHIFTRLGLWDECIRSNFESVVSAQCYAGQTGIKGHWDEELHGLDYLTYAYLQEGNNDSAKKQWDYLETIREVHPVNFKVAYAFAAIPSRYLLENKYWKDAAGLERHKANISWNNFPWESAIIHFTRALGFAHIGDTEAAKAELNNLQAIYDTLVNQKDTYKANQVMIQIKAAEAWIFFEEKKNDEALKLMYAAADMEDRTEKHPVTPGEVLPAKELLGDMLLQMNKPAEALQAYESDLKTHPNRFNGLYGAALSAERSGETGKANYYYQLLIKLAGGSGSGRPELETARVFLAQKN